MFYCGQKDAGAGADDCRSGDIQQQASPQEAQDELMNLMTIMYIAIQETLSDPEDMSSAYGKLRASPHTAPPHHSFSVLTDPGPVELNPSLVDFMLTATSKLRWDEQSTMPHTQVSRYHTRPAISLPADQGRSFCFSGNPFCSFSAEPKTSRSLRKLQAR